MAGAPARHGETLGACLTSIGVDIAALIFRCEDIKQEFALIRNAFLNRVLECHPEKGGNPVVFLDVLSAFEVLRDLFYAGRVKSFVSKGSMNKATDKLYKSSIARLADMPTPSLDFFAKAGLDLGPAYRVELGKRLASEAGVCVGMIDTASGVYRHWVRLADWPVPSKVWLGLPDPQVFSNVAKFEAAMLSMNEVVFCGLSELPAARKRDFLAHLMDKGRWEQHTKRPSTRNQGPSDGMMSPTSSGAADEPSATNAPSSAPLASSSFHQHFLARKQGIVGVKDAPDSSTSIETVTEEGEPTQHQAIFAVPVPGKGPAVPGILKGMNVVITGVFPELGGGSGLNLGKAKMKKIVESFGGKVTGRISGRTNILVEGKDPVLSKVYKARAMQTCKTLSLLELRRVLVGARTLDDPGMSALPVDASTADSNAKARGRPAGKKATTAAKGSTPRAKGLQYVKQDNAGKASALKPKGGVIKAKGSAKASTSKSRGRPKQAKAKQTESSKSKAKPRRSKAPAKGAAADVTDKANLAVAPAARNDTGSPDKNFGSIPFVPSMAGKPALQPTADPGPSGEPAKEKIPDTPSTETCTLGLDSGNTPIPAAAAQTAANAGESLADPDTVPATPRKVNRCGSFAILVPGEGSALPGALKDMTIVMTGVFPEVGGGGRLNIGKDRVKAMLESFGGRVTNNVSGRTDILLVGEDPSFSKAQKARESPKCQMLTLLELRGILEGVTTLDSLRNEPQLNIDSYSGGFNGNGLNPLQPASAVGKSNLATPKSKRNAKVKKQSKDATPGTNEQHPPENSTVVQSSQHTAAVKELKEAEKLVATGLSLGELESLLLLPADSVSCGDMGSSLKTLQSQLLEVCSTPPPSKATGKGLLGKRSLQDGQKEDAQSGEVTDIKGSPKKTKAAPGKSSPKKLAKNQASAGKSSPKKVAKKQSKPEAAVSNFSSTSLVPTLSSFFSWGRRAIAGSVS